MQNFLIVLLAIFIVGVLYQDMLVAIVLAGLLAMLVWTMSRSRELRERVAQLENQLAGAKTGKKEEPVAPAQTPTAVAEAPSVSRAAATRHAPTVTEPAPRPTPPAPARVPVFQPRQIPSAATANASRTEAKAPPPAGPVVPPFIEKLLQGVWKWFTGGNVFVRVGIVILFMGMTFLVQHAVGNNMIPIGFRLAAVAAAAIALLYWGWRQRATRSNFALVVQGGGVGLLYLTIFASFSLYSVIPSPAAFALLALVVVVAAMLAILQDARSLALFATAGGFLAPVLTSSGSNDYIGLFSYYTLLNLGIFTIAWFKSWRLLNFVGFVFTFAISTAWGVLNYESEFFATTEPFLIIFFLLYVVISIVFANRREPFYKDYVDSTLVFGTPLLAFGLQCAMVNEYEYGVAISAGGLGVFYILLTQFIWSRYRDSLKLLSETFLSLGVIFLTLAIPFAIDGTLTGATWAIEGAGILWVSIKQQQKYRRLFGQALVVASGLVLGYELVSLGSHAADQLSRAFLNSAFIGCVIIAVAASACSWLLSKEFPGKLQLEKLTAHGLLVFGLLVLLIGFEYQIFDFDLMPVHGTLLAILTAVSVLLYTLAGDKLRWHQAHWVAVAFVLPMIFAAWLCYDYQPQLAVYYGYLVWPVTVLSYFYALKRALLIVHPNMLMMAHCLLALIIAALLFWEGLWQLMLGYAVLTVGFNVVGDKWQWPQLKTLALGFLPVLVLGAVAAISKDGDLISLSNIAADVVWPFPPGYILWPLAFTVYFYVLHQNPRVNGVSTSGLHYGGAGLIAALFLWLGLWPLLLASSLLTLLCCYLWRRLSWQQMRITALALLPVMLLVALWKLLSGNLDPFDLEAFNVGFQPAFETGYFLWPLAFASLLWSFWQFDNQKVSVSPWLHGLALLLPVGLLTWEASWHLLDYVGLMNGWHLALLPLATLLAFRLVMKPPCWPFTIHYEDYRRFALVPLALALIGWSLLQLFSSGDSAPLPWLPLFSPIDIVQAVVVMVVLIWFGKVFSGLENPPSARVITMGLMVFAFIWANVDLLRAVHHWAGVAWQSPVIFTADVSQMALSLFWTLCGLATTFYAGKKAHRRLWIFGAALLCVVILKLFLIDLSASGTVERIVSFTGVGLLLVLVGYFSPLPPNKEPPNENELTEGAAP